MLTGRQRRYGKASRSGRRSKSPDKRRPGRSVASTSPSTMRVSSPPSSGHPVLWLCSDSSAFIVG